MQSFAAAGADEGRLLIERLGIQVKIEANLVFRGTVVPVEHRSLALRAAEMFNPEPSVPSCALDELHGSELVAALDRQHPRHHP